MGTNQINETKQTHLRNAGYASFFLSGICAISSGVVVSLLQEVYGFDYGMTGTLLSLMSIGNLLAGFAAGVLPGKLGMKATVTLLTIGYAAGYLLMGLSGLPVVLMLGFFLVGVDKGATLNTCTILVGDNVPDRPKGMNLMHSCYALGALLCPFLIALAARFGALLPLFLLAALGLCQWCVFAATPMQRKTAGKAAAIDWGFLKSPRFWLLTGLLFCQNAAETGVTGWMVTYFKGSGIIAGSLSAYTVTIMWGATLVARLLIAFVFPFKNAHTAMLKMSAACIVFYIGLMLAHSQLAAVLLLFAFAFSMAGMNPTAVACAGRMTSVTSMGVMLPVASSGAILMPWIIGIVAEDAGLGFGMATNIVPCIGLLLFAFAVHRLAQKEAAAV